jgi:hypothetical protein
MKTSRSPQGGASELPRECLRSDCASTTFFALSLRIYGVHTALLWRSHCAEIVKLRESAIHTQYKRGKNATQPPYKQCGQSRRSFGFPLALSRRSCCVARDATELLRRSYCYSTTRLFWACSKWAPSIGVLCDATTMLWQCYTAMFAIFCALTSAFWIFFGRRENAVLVWQGF